jgi:succinate-acetate transporter protein
VSGPTPGGAPPGTPERIVLRPLATPLPLGFAALAVVSAAYAAVQLGWAPPAETSKAALVALAFTVPLQLISMLVGVAARDPVAGTGMGIQAGLWALTGLTGLSSAPGTTSIVFGVALVGIAALLLVPVSANTSKPLCGAVFLGTSAHSACLAVHELSGSPGWETATGGVGIGLAVLAAYAALAYELEEARGRPVVPMFRGRSVREQGEPGVRPEL